jgi:hypothetical protein
LNDLRDQGEQEGWERQRHIHARVPEPLLASPFVLRSQREGQALPRPEQGADAEYVRIALQLDVRGVPPRSR